MRSRNRMNAGKAVILFVTLLGMLALSACGSSTPDQASSSGLDGTVWTLSTLKGQPLMPGTSISAEFIEGNRIGGSAGCNTYTGSYTISGNSINIDASTMPSTMMACDQAVMDQESQYLKALGDVSTYRVDGAELTMADASNNAIAVYRSVSQDLAGTDWEVLNYNNGRQTVVGLAPGTKITVRFGQDGTISGSSGCNEFSGPYKAGDKQITIGPLASTGRECIEPAGAMKQEAEFLAALATAATYQVRGAGLELHTAEDAMAAFMKKK